MRVLLSNNESNRQNSARTFLILSFSALGVAIAYFGAMYLIVH